MILRGSPNFVIMTNILTKVTTLYSASDATGSLSSDSFKPEHMHLFKILLCHWFCIVIVY